MLLFIPFLCCISVAQEIGFVAQEKDDNTTKIEIYPHPQQADLYIYSEIYLKTGRIKTTGNSLSSKSPRFQGPVTTFFADGTLASEITYRNGEKLGRANYYYKNGALMKQVDHLQIDSGANKLHVDYRMIHFFDSSGKQLVKDGQGTCREYGTDGESWEEGEYQNGMRQGVWKGRTNDGVVYKEAYRQGKRVSRSLLEH